MKRLWKVSLRVYLYFFNCCCNLRHTKRVILFIIVLIVGLTVTYIDCSIWTFAMITERCKAHDLRFDLRFDLEDLRFDGKYCDGLAPGFWVEEQV